MNIALPEGPVALAGLKAPELGQLIAGPFAAKTLAIARAKAADTRPQEPQITPTETPCKDEP